MNNTYEDNRSISKSRHSMMLDLKLKLIVSDGFLNKNARKT